jgi:RNA polymerase sigma-70 factor (ECF subfamily)
MTMMLPPNSQSAIFQLNIADATLVDRVRAGDPAAFELIMRRNNQRLYRLARGIFRSRSEAEDLVQEAYVRCYEKLNDFVGPNGSSAWIGKIVVNERSDGCASKAE